MLEPCELWQEGIGNRTTSLPAAAAITSVTATTITTAGIITITAAPAVPAGLRGSSARWQQAGCGTALAPTEG